MLKGWLLNGDWIRYFLIGSTSMDQSLPNQTLHTTTRAAALANQVIYEFSLLGIVRFWKHNVVKNKNQK